jgi:cation transport regulator
MPYRRNAELPPPVRKLPAGGQTIYRKTWNSVASDGGSESKAAKIAWAAVKKSYRKDGERWVRRAG